ncbi:MAG TPA: hypothetical protein VFK13_15505 [Gemmatimonadaceae bacterium]|nr:hypothetical protein [Gemmatimonadaceae bacterium]
MTASGSRSEPSDRDGGEVSVPARDDLERTLRTYAMRRERFAAERAALEQRASAVAHARLAVFVGAALALVVLGTTPEPRSMTIALAVAAVGLSAAFIWLALHHGTLKDRARRAEALARINAEGESRARREWSVLPAPSWLTAPSDHPYAVDLDVLGHASLAQLCGPTGTSAGVATLRAWLLEPASAVEIGERQAAVRELAPMEELRDTLAAEGRLAGESHPTITARFLEWSEGEPWLERRGWLLWTARLLPLVAIAALIGQLTGLAPTRWWWVPLLLTALLTRMYAARIRETYARAAPPGGPLRKRARALRLLEEAPFTAPRLRRLQAELVVDGEPAHRQARQLEQLATMAEVRLSPMLYLPVQLLTMWDFHVVHRLERWQRRSGTRARRWLDAVGEAEALSALATVSHDHPSWCFAELVDDARTVEARALGHPLLSPRDRVDNDVTVGPPGSFLFITGSNMSGKSTLLRAIGANVVLALAGGPSCAERLRLPVVRVATSMRVQDSLERGVSFFMAELERLKLVVEGARSAAADGPPVLYLLDEMLQGTNTAERRIAARMVIRALLESGAIGAVTSHDLALVDEAPLDSAARAVHFTEQVVETPAGPKMTFDYRLRPGVATSRNALALVRAMGLG